MFNNVLTCKASARLGVGSGALLATSCVLTEIVGGSASSVILMTFSIILAIPTLFAGITNRREAGDEMYERNMGRASVEAGWLLMFLLTLLGIAAQLFISDYEINVINGCLFVIGAYEFLQSLFFLRAEGDADACYED